MGHMVSYSFSLPWFYVLHCAKFTYTSETWDYEFKASVDKDYETYVKV